MIVGAYAIGVIRPHSRRRYAPGGDFNGKYFMRRYLAVCILTLVVSRLQRRRQQRR